MSSNASSPVFWVRELSGSGGMAHLHDIDERDLRDVALIRTGAGACLRGCFRRTGRQVAVKLLTNGKWIDRIQKAGLSRLCSEHVLVPLGVYRTHSLVGLVWDWMAKGSLDSALHETELFSELSVALCLRILLDVAEGLAHLHSISLPHGALKATNVLLDQQYRAKLCDWGQEMDMNLMTNISNGCRPCYRDLAYVSPEGTVPSVEADIYSFGILLWEALTRKRPCEGIDQLQIFMLSAQEKMDLGVGVDRVQPVVSQNHVLTQLIVRCLHCEPKKRPSAEECAIVLHTVLAAFDPHSVTDAVRHLNTCKEKKLLSCKTRLSWELPIELHNLDQHSNCKSTKNWTSKVIPRNDAHSKLEATGKISLPMRNSHPEIRCCRGSENYSVQLSSSCSDHAFSQTPGHCGGLQRQSSTSSRSPCVSPTTLFQSTPQHNAGNQVTCQVSARRSCCQLLQERREAIVRFMTEGRLNNLLDVLRAKRAVTRETYEIITAPLTLTDRTRCLLDICSCQGENVAILVATILGLVSTGNTQMTHKWQSG